MKYNVLNEQIVILDNQVVSNWRVGSRTPAISKMEFFLILVNSFQPLTNVTKSVLS